MNAQTKTTIVNPTKPPANVEFPLELLAHVAIEKRATNIAGIYGFRVRCIADDTGEARLIMAAAQYADDYALGVDGVRGERLGTGERPNYSTAAGGYTQTQLDALKRHRETCEAVGVVNVGWLHYAVIDCMTAKHIGEIMACSDKTAATRVRDALETLADWYETPKPKRRATK